MCVMMCENVCENENEWTVVEGSLFSERYIYQFKFIAKAMRVSILVKIVLHCITFD